MVRVPDNVRRPPVNEVTLVGEGSTPQGKRRVCAMSKGWEYIKGMQASSKSGTLDHEDMNSGRSASTAV